jgi:hypothetical protein
MYKTIVLPVVLYGCETWFFAFVEEYRLRVFDNRMLRRIIEPKRYDVAGRWRKLRNEEFHRRMGWPRLITRIGGDEKCVQRVG